LVHRGGRPLPAHAASASTRAFELSPPPHCARCHAQVFKNALWPDLPPCVRPASSPRPSFALTQWFGDSPAAVARDPSLRRPNPNRCVSDAAAGYRPGLRSALRARDARIPGFTRALRARRPGMLLGGPGGLAAWVFAAWGRVPAAVSPGFPDPRCEAWAAWAGWTASVAAHGLHRAASSLPGGWWLSERRWKRFCDPGSAITAHVFCVCDVVRW